MTVVLSGKFSGFSRRGHLPRPAAAPPAGVERTCGGTLSSAAAFFFGLDRGFALPAFTSRRSGGLPVGDRTGGRGPARWPLIPPC